ncbi:MAG: hypothetical protein MHM6MM_006863, partial [Cercozoa sp. M6MM]
MGVPAFFVWLAKKYPACVSDWSPEFVEERVPKSEVHNLYLDMNGIIHPCSHPESGFNASKKPKSEAEIMKNICDYIDVLLERVKPTKLLYLAVDGVAPRAKMNQQRARRYRSAMDREQYQLVAQRLGVQTGDSGHDFDSNVITPGTSFMCKVEATLKDYARRVSKKHNLTCVVSDANVPGEGEHKVMDYIRRARNAPGYDPNTTHVLYGLDADLIMLALATHETHFYVLRDKPSRFHKGKDKKDKRFGVQDYQVCEIGVLRDYFEREFSHLDFERVIDDFVLLCFFAGNDFLPELPGFDIRDGALDTFLDIYKQQWERGLYGGRYLTDGNKAYVDLEALDTFVAGLVPYEIDALRAQHQRRKQQQQNLFKKIFPNGSNNNNSENNDNDKNSNTENNNIENNNTENNNIENNNTENNSGETFEDPKVEIERLKELVDRGQINSAKAKKRIVKILEKAVEADTLKLAMTTSEIVDFDAARTSTNEWRRAYYRHKFGFEDFAKLNEVRDAYIRGLQWIFAYYYGGRCIWDYYYPYHYAPLPGDLVNCDSLEMHVFSRESTQQMDVPLMPQEQLCAVLPPQSAHRCLPAELASLVCRASAYNCECEGEDAKTLEQYYPKQGKVSLDLNGRHRYAVCVCVCVCVCV